MKYTIKYTEAPFRGVYAKAYNEDGYVTIGSGNTREEARKDVIMMLEPLKDLGSEEIEIPEEEMPVPDEKQMEIENNNLSLLSNNY